MAKSAEAFRTISEVADWLGSPAHVLRFWESKFSQVKPVKRAGGRRYYRPTDMLLLGGIKKLLHDDGMTIKGVQKILREQGVKHVADLSRPLEGVIEEAPFEGSATPVAPAETTAQDGAQVLPFQKDDPSEKAPPDLPAEQLTDAPAPDSETEDTGIKAVAEEPSNSAAEPVAGDPDPALADATPASDTTVLNDFAAGAEADAPVAEAEATSDDAPDDFDDIASPVADDAPQADAATLDEDAATSDEDDNRLTDIPAFLHREKPQAEPDAPSPGDTPLAAEHETETPPEPETPRPAVIELPADPADDEIDAAPGLLATLAALNGRGLTGANLAQIGVQRDKLAALLARQNNPHHE
jgi:DNA-binding transcriptional MerR regulator